jgi:hypothetical protein
VGSCYFTTVPGRDALAAWQLSYRLVQCLSAPAPHCHETPTACCLQARKHPAQQHLSAYFSCRHTLQQPCFFFCTLASRSPRISLLPRVALPCRLMCAVSPGSWASAACGRFWRSPSAL